MLNLLNNLNIINLCLKNKIIKKKYYINFKNIKYILFLKKLGVIKNYYLLNNGINTLVIYFFNFFNFKRTKTFYKYFKNNFKIKLNNGNLKKLNYNYIIKTNVGLKLLNNNSISKFNGYLQFIIFIIRIPRVSLGSYPLQFGAIPKF